jgi:hypothetical protein
LQQLRKLADAERAKVTKQLALQIRQLPTAEREGLADALSNLATEGDLGRDTLQEVTNTLAQALAEQRGRPESYLDLARLVRCEHMRVSLNTRSSGTLWPNWKPTTRLASGPISL